MKIQPCNLGIVHLTGQFLSLIPVISPSALFLLLSTFFHRPSRVSAVARMANFGFSAGDIILVSKYAWDVYKASKRAGEDFKDITTDGKYARRFATDGGRS